MLTSYQRRIYLYGAISVHEIPGLPIRQFQRATGGGNRAGPRDLLQHGDLARADLASALGALENFRARVSMTASKPRRKSIDQSTAAAICHTVALATAK
jgi:hypothetical protein